MPLIPGVLRGPSGEINMSGARASQSATELNGADVTDPVTRTTQINLPTETVSSVQVLTSPYDTQYGGFAGAVSTVETKPASLSKLKNQSPEFHSADPQTRWSDHGNRVEHAAIHGHGAPFGRASLVSFTRRSTSSYGPTRRTPTYPYLKGTSSARP